jgi:hypothetical protein
LPTGLTLVNAGRIAFAPGGAGVDVLSGFSASVTNQTGGTISGSTAAIYASGTVTVLNAGGIAANGTSGVGVKLLAGGSVTNQSGGTISAYIGIAGTGTGTGTGAAVTVLNAGSIAGSTTGAYGAGVYLSAGGSVTSQGGGAISGHDGIVGSGAPVAVVNDGGVTAVGTYGRGVDLFAGGSVTNQSAGTVSGFRGIYGTGGAVAVVNDGRIAGAPADAGSTGVDLVSGGSVTNAAKRDTSKALTPATRREWFCRKLPGRTQGNRVKASPSVSWPADPRIKSGDGHDTGAKSCVCDVHPIALGRTCDPRQLSDRWAE